MSSAKSHQINALRRLADARKKRADATLAGARQAFQRRDEAHKHAQATAQEKAEEALDYTRQRFLSMGETNETANAFIAIAAGASEARRIATSSELTAIRAEQRKQEAERARTTAAIICREISERIDRLDTLYSKDRRMAQRRLDQMQEDEISENFRSG